MNFSEARFLDFLSHFGLEDKVSRKKGIGLLLNHQNFQINMLYTLIQKKELQNFCSAISKIESHNFRQKSILRLRVSGTKQQIWNRIIEFLENPDFQKVEIQEIEKNMYNIIITTTNCEKIRIHNSLKMLYNNAFEIAQHYVDNKDYLHGDDKESAIKKLKEKQPFVSLEQCIEAFNYMETVYKEAYRLVDQYKQHFWDDLKRNGLRAIDEITTDYPTKLFKKSFLDKYSKLEDKDLWIFNFIFEYHHVR